MKRLLFLVLTLALLAGLSGCHGEGCLGGEEKCRVPPPCPKVNFACEGPSSDRLAVKVVEGPSDRPGGWNALASKGDVRLSNAFVDVVIANIGAPILLDPNGGSIRDLTPAGQPEDTVNQVLQVVGILPRDAAFYTSLEIIDERPVRGGRTGEGHPRWAAQCPHHHEV